MGHLRDKRVYLSGPIQHDVGINWRLEPKRVLTDEFGLNLFDPFEDPKQQWIPQLKKAQEELNFKLMADVCHQFVRKDLCMVDRSDIVIAYLPHKVPTVGTHHEIINSNNAKKPTLLVTNHTDVSHIPLWYFGFIPLEFMFAGWEALYIYLREVDAGNHMHNNRWNYTYGLI